MSSDFEKYRAELRADAARISAKPVQQTAKELHDDLIDALTGNSVYSDEEAEKRLAYYVALSQQDCKESP